MSRHRWTTHEAQVMADHRWWSQDERNSLAGGSRDDADPRAALAGVLGVSAEDIRVRTATE